MSEMTTWNDPKESRVITTNLSCVSGGQGLEEVISCLPCKSTCLRISRSFISDYREMSSPSHDELSPIFLLVSYRGPSWIRSLFVRGVVYGHFATPFTSLSLIVPPETLVFSSS